MDIRISFGWLAAHPPWVQTEVVIKSIFPVWLSNSERIGENINIIITYYVLYFPPREHSTFVDERSINHFI